MDSPKTRQLQAEILRRLREERIRYFRPHGGQEDFLRLLDEPGAFIVVSGAGNGWGKSSLIAAIFAAAMWPNMAPPALASIAKDWQKFPHRARIYSKPAELEEIGSLQTAITRLFPKGRYESFRGRYSYPSVFRADTGWVMDLFSYERHESEAAGPNIGVQGFNEPPPEPLWKEAVARSRAGGVIIGGMTSLLDNPWVAGGLLEKHNGKDIRIRFGDACENCKQHGKNGNLEHAQIERILAQYDPDEREARKTGKPLSLSGRIFKAWSRAAHVAPEPIIPPAGGIAHYMAMDPAIGKPCFAVWAYVDASDRLVVYDEYPEHDFRGAKDSNLTVSDYCQIFKAKEQGRQIQCRILDRHFGNTRRTMGGLTLKQEFFAAGYEFIDSYHVGEEQPEVETGILKVKDYLRYDAAKTVDALNQPKLLVSPSCRNTIAAMENWSRNAKTGKPSDDYKDGADCIRYLVMANPHIEAVRDWGTHHALDYGVGNV